MDLFSGAGGLSLGALKAGIQIPLWENSYEVKSSSLEFETHKLMLEDEKNQIVLEITINYNLSNSLKKNLDEISLLLQESNNEDFLNKSLELGEISIIDYFLELSFYYEIIDS